MDDLPNYFDVIIVGTGMPECIVAAAAARVGKKVLHLDRNGYYGGDWASFSFDKFVEWIDEVKVNNEVVNVQNDLGSSLASFLREDETLIMCPTQYKSISNLCVKSNIREFPEVASSLNATEENADIPPSECDIVENAPPDLQSTVNASNQETSDIQSSDSQRNSVEIPSNTETPSEPPQVQQEWTVSTFMENRRKFNIDLAPKIMFSRGSLVELLISSNIARYAEFQCVNRVLTYINGHIEQVPCSRADVFSTKNVSVVEKRMLMKFLNFCLKYEDQEEEFNGAEELPFVEFLRSKKLTPNVEHYIVHAIAMVPETCTTLQGLKATQKFLQSLGRYGNSPFLSTCYGSAELPQCFCRLCAVYEGMYYLKRKVEAITFKNNKCSGVISLGQRIDCQWLILESSYAPSSFYSSNSLQSLSRAILITDSSIHPSEKKESTLLKFPPSAGCTNPITILELSSKNYVCPEDLYLVYMYCRSSSLTAEDDLKPVVNLLFKNEGSSGESQEIKPNVLWSVFYNQRDTSTSNLNSNKPEGIFLTPSPDIELDYENAVHEARKIFESMCPGEEFLPRAPDPEDILIENHNNPGDEESVGKIENDVTDSEEEKDNSKHNVNTQNSVDCENQINEENLETE